MEVKIKVKGRPESIKEKLCRMFGCDKFNEPIVVVVSFGNPKPKPNKEK